MWVEWLLFVSDSVLVSAGPGSGEGGAPGDVTGGWFEPRDVAVCIGPGVSAAELPDRAERVKALGRRMYGA